MDVDFLPAVLLGRAVLQRLEVVKPEIVLDSASRGVSAATRTNVHPATLPPFDIRRVDLRDLALTVVTSPTTQVSVRRLSVALVGEGAGRLRGTALISDALSVKHAAGGLDFSLGDPRVDSVRFHVQELPVPLARWRQAQKS